MSAPDTLGFRWMSISIMVDSEADVKRVIGWVNQFEPISAIGAVHPHHAEVGFYAESLEQLHRIVDYVASWEGETTPTVANCPECEAQDLKVRR